MISKEIWSAELDQERDFWWEWLTTDKPEIRSQRELRLQPNRQLPADIQKYLPRDGGPSRTLDVGAGPLTSLGTMSGKQPVELVAIDALAREYDEMLSKLGINPPVRTHFGEGENLVEQFGRDAFDAVNCANALDHFFDPMKALVEGLHVLKMGGVFRVRTHQNVGEKESYHGLHQWNFALRDERLFLWNPTCETDVLEALAPLARVRELYIDDAGMLLFILQKGPADLT